MTTTTTTYYAAYDDCAVYGVGPTPEDAIARAQHEARSPDGEFDTAQISGELAAWIELHGWNGLSESFDVTDGWLVRTTGA